MTQARFDHLDVFQEPRCLIETVVNGKTNKRDLQINEDVLSQIIEIDVPISVVGICGVYRSGKSYLMNRLAEAGKGLKGFELGGTVNSVTKGIWVLCKIHPKHPNEVLVLLDTEGLSDSEKGDEEHDMKLFCLTMLMSSVLIYNMKGVINHEALKKLSFITEVTKMVSVSSKTFTTEDEEKNALQVISPHFVFCLRDFFYGLGKSKTEDEYMESCLKELDTSHKQTNDIRKSIKDFFPDRKCFTITLPAMMDEELQCLGSLSEENLNVKFREQCLKMTTYVHGLGSKVVDKVTQIPWTGKAFASFLRSYTEGLSKDMKMDFGNAMVKAGEAHNKELVSKYVQEFKKRVEEEKLPKPTTELSAFWNRHITSLMFEFRMKLYPYELELFENKAMKKLEKILSDLLSTNNSKQTEICFDYLSTEYDKMMKGNTAEYEEDYGKYDKDFAQLLKNYTEKFNSYHEGLHEALRKFEESAAVLEGKATIKLKSELKKLAHEKERSKSDVQAAVEMARIEMKKDQQSLKDNYEKNLSKYVNLEAELKKQTEKMKEMKEKLDAQWSCLLM